MKSSLQFRPRLNANSKIAPKPLNHEDEILKQQIKIVPLPISRLEKIIE